MNVRKTDEFIADVEWQFEWYVLNAGGPVADRYLDAVEAACHLLGQHARLGPCAGFAQPRLRDWRFFVVFRPFNKHILFYEVMTDNVVMRRAMHGHRDLPKRLREPPQSK
ncbi:MAG: type II toxin-antitoxin system RelE/ParE family toxin [Verrucomicrobia bacterium]|nr:type II toxin-antitoxin system RelE/ParE family toxin [Verrucomicrobiota bacterium]